jgi:hypothetical protein
MSSEKCTSGSKAAHFPAHLPHDLSRLIDFWPDLPAEARAEILRVAAEAIAGVRTSK